MTRTFILMLLLAGCATPQDWAQNAIRYYGPACEKLGMKPQTPEFGQCVIKLAEMHRSGNY